MAAGNYILCDIGCVPNKDDSVLIAEQALEANEKIGMIRFLPDSEIRVCRKGIVEKWPMNKSGSYQIEHEQAYIMEGYQVPQWPSLQYRKLGVH